MAISKKGEGKREERGRKRRKKGNKEETKFFPLLFYVAQCGNGSWLLKQVFRVYGCVSVCVSVHGNVLYDGRLRGCILYSHSASH